MRFVDSYKFLSTSIQKLVDNMKDDDFSESKKYYAQKKQLKLMQQKGVFPYRFLDNLYKLNVECIPLKEVFFDELNGEHISSEGYKRARNVGKLFNCKNLGHYSDIYLKTDVLLLCDEFESFRRKCLEHINSTRRAIKQALDYLGMLC